MKNFRIHVKYEEEEIEIIFLVISIFLIFLSYNFISKRKYVLLTVAILDEIIGLFALQTLLALFAFSTCAFFNFNARIYFSNNITLSTKILGDFKRCEQI